jgi:hypothetical protein
MEIGFPVTDQIVTQLLADETTMFHDAVDELAWPQRRRVTNVTGSSLAPSTDDSGTIYLLNRAAGIAVTLPAITATEVGVTFEFYVGTTFSGGSGVITAAAGDLLTGSCVQYDADTSQAVAFRNPDGSDDLICTLNGSTQGGIVGTLIRYVATSATSWLVTGSIQATGAVATPFS